MAKGNKDSTCWFSPIIGKISTWKTKLQRKGIPKFLLFMKEFESKVLCCGDWVGS